MPEEGAKRRLAAILSADAVGYSRLMAENEAETIRLLKSCRALISIRVEEHHGRIVNAPGDNMLCEFLSALDATQCAVAIQQALEDRNADLPEDQKMKFRIGIHLGDVVADTDGVYGDGVNIAARIEASADAGGICVSDMVHKQVSSKIDIPLEDMGSFEFKNIPYPIQVYKVQVGQEPFAADQKPKAPVASSRKPTIAVLAFENMSSDPEQGYFSDGISEDILNGLAQNRSLDAIAAMSSFQFKGKNQDVRSIGKQLGATHILRGSVRRAGNRIRVTTQLIETDNGTNLWSEQYNRDLTDVFEMQDEIANSVLSELKVHLVGLEHKEAPTASPEAYDAYLLGCHYLGTSDLSQALASFERAVSLDQQYAAAYGHLAYTQSLYLWWQQNSTAEKLPILRHYIDKALALNPKQQDALSVKAFDYLCVQNAYQEAINLLHSLARNHPNEINILISLMSVYEVTGQYDLEYRIVDRMTKLNPLSGRANLHHARVSLLLGRLNEAKRYIERMEVLGLPNPWLICSMAFTAGDSQKIDEHLSKGRQSWGKQSQWHPVFDAASMYLKGESARLRETLASYRDTNRLLQPFFLSIAAALEDNIDMSLCHYSKALSEGEFQAFVFIQEPVFFRRIFPDYRSHPKYQKMLKDVGLDDESIGKLKIPPLPF